MANGNIAEVADDHTCKLLQLPVELRFRIYEYALASAMLLEKDYKAELKKATAILCTCHELHDEAFQQYQHLVNHKIKQLEEQKLRMKALRNANDVECILDLSNTESDDRDFDEEFRMLCVARIGVLQGSINVSRSRNKSRLMTKCLTLGTKKLRARSALRLQTRRMNKMRLRETVQQLFVKMLETKP